MCIFNIVVFHLILFIFLTIPNIMFKMQMCSIYADDMHFVVSLQTQR